MYRYFLLLGLLALLAACNNEQNSSVVQLAISAQGEMKVVPDMASINISLGCTNKDVNRARACTGSALDEVFSLLQENQLGKNDYHTSILTLEKEYDWKRSSRVFTGYKASTTLTVVFRDLEVMSRVMNKILQMDRAEVYGLSYSHSKYAELSQQAYLIALDNAEKLAGEIKKKQKASTIELVTISNMDTQIGGVVEKNYADGLARAKMANEVAQSPSVAINPGELVLVKNIYVTYRMLN